MIFLGQDKGRGPKWPKPLSAHLFSRDARGLGWDAILALCAKKANEKIRIVRKRAGTRIKRGRLTPFGSCFR